MKLSIGIDPSLSNTALCFYSSTQATLPHTECRNAGAAVKGLARIDRFGSLIDAVVGLCVEASPDVVVIEGYSYASKGRAILTMAEFGGLLRSRLLALPCKLVEVSPSELKKWATGKGNANKTQVVTALVKRYGVEYDQDDEYDAFALAKMGSQIQGWEKPATAIQVCVIEKLKARQTE